MVRQDEHVELVGQSLETRKQSADNHVLTESAYREPRSLYLHCTRPHSSLPNVVAYSEERWVFSAASVCLWVCVFVNTITSERVNIVHRTMKLGGCAVQKSRPSSNLGAMPPEVRTPKNVAFGYDVGKISAGCLVHSFIHHFCSE